jgi:hypothetical protein
MVVLFEQAGVALGVLVVGLLVIIAALVVAVVLLLRSLRRPPPPLVADPAVPRVTADVRAGGEQIVLSLARSLGIASSRNEAAYGELYVIASREDLLRLGSRSEIGRGFAGEVRIRRTPDGSRVEYVVLALPGDEELHGRVRRVDEQIVEGLRNVDRSARIQRPRAVRPLL